MATSINGPHGNIPKRDFDTIKLPTKEFGISFLLMGSTRSGKSTLMNYIYEHIFRKSHITICHTFSPQSAIYEPLKKHIALVGDYHPELLKENYLINKKTGNHYQFLHIIDDVINKRNCPELRKLFTIYRNSRISGIICGQSLTIFDNISRGNINYVCLGYLNSDTTIEQCIKSYLQSVFPSNLKMVDKIKLYKQLTSEHQFILIDNIHGDIFQFKLDL
jgi:AAA+ ATPase superfamily predicted ATPase